MMNIELSGNRRNTRRQDPAKRGRSQRSSARLPESFYQKLLEYALRILSKKRYTVAKMCEKLERTAERSEAAIPPEEAMTVINQVLARLHELNYLDDEAFARDYIHDRINFKPRGKFLLKRELKLKGIPPEIAEIAIETAKIDEAALAAECLKKHSRKLENLDPKKRRERAFRLLGSRGFDLDTIYKTINS
jgi:SOS response regulatory protein OraA/RecX